MEHVKGKKTHTRKFCAPQNWPSDITCSHTKAEVWVYSKLKETLRKSQSSLTQKVILYHSESYKNDDAS